MHLLGLNDRLFWWFGWLIVEYCIVPIEGEILVARAKARALCGVNKGTTAYYRASRSDASRGYQRVATLIDCIQGSSNEMSFFESQVIHEFGITS